MKKLFMTLCIALVSVGGVYAKGTKDVGIKGTWAAGLNLSYGTKVSSPGIGAEAEYGLTNHVRLDAGLDYFFKTNDLSMLDFNVNANWLFKMKRGFMLYPLVGISYSHWKGDLTEIEGLADVIENAMGQKSREEEEAMKNGTKNMFGFNFGGGAQYDLNDNWAVKAEVKFQLLFGGGSQCVIGVGAVYKF